MKKQEKLLKKNILQFKKDLKNCSKADILNALFEEFAEEHMIQPTFVCDYPSRNITSYKEEERKS